SSWFPSGAIACALPCEGVKRMSALLHAGSPLTPDLLSSAILIVIPSTRIALLRAHASGSPDVRVTRDARSKRPPNLRGRAKAAMRDGPGPALAASAGGRSRRARSSGGEQPPRDRFIRCSGTIERTRRPGARASPPRWAAFGVVGFRAASADSRPPD